MMDEGKRAVADRIIESHQHQKSALIAILQEIQDEYRYLPQDVLNYVSQQMNISPSKIFSVATFYKNFSLDVKGKHVIKVCDGTACHVRKSSALLKALQEELGLGENGGTTPDMLFTLETVSCLGACGLAPVITINDVVYPKVTPEAAKEVVNSIRKDEQA